MPINIERGSMVKDLLRALFSGSRIFSQMGILWGRIFVYTFDGERPLEST